MPAVDVLEVQKRTVAAMDEEKRQERFGFVSDLFAQLREDYIRNFDFTMKAALLAYLTIKPGEKKVFRTSRIRIEVTPDELKPTCHKEKSRVHH